MDDVKNIIHYIAEDNLDGAQGAFKAAMSRKLMEKIETREKEIQQEIAEQYPEIFDSEADKDFVAKHVVDVEGNPETDEDPAGDDAVQPEQGHREADYDEEEDQMVYEEESEDDDSVEEETDEEEDSE
jgi:hypothetical protein